ncbi:protein of unknown function [Pseudomonas mediterranea]
MNNPLNQFNSFKYTHLESHQSTQSLPDHCALLPRQVETSWPHSERIYPCQRSSRALSP